MEVRRIELLTPCLQSRCSPSWAIPPTKITWPRSYFPYPIISSWWVWEDLNFRPHAYQACALTTWATNPSRFDVSTLRGYVDSIYSFRLWKEVIQPQVPLRLPCYDFAPVADPTVVARLLLLGYLNAVRQNQLPWRDGRCVQDPGTYSRGRCWCPFTSDSDFIQSSCRL